MKIRGRETKVYSLGSKDVRFVDLELKEGDCIKSIVDDNFDIDGCSGECQHTYMTVGCNLKTKKISEPASIVRGPKIILYPEESDRLGLYSDDDFIRWYKENRKDITSWQEKNYTVFAYKGERIGEFIGPKECVFKRLIKFTDPEQKLCYDEICKYIKDNLFMEGIDINYV